MRTIQQEHASQHVQQLQLQLLMTLLQMTSARNAWECVQTVSSLRNLNIFAYHSAQILQWHYSFTMWTLAASQDAQKDTTQTQADKSAPRSVQQTQTYSPWSWTTRAFPNVPTVHTRTQAREHAPTGAPKQPFNTLTTPQTSALMSAQPHLTIMVWTGLMEIRFVYWLVV